MIQHIIKEGEPKFIILSEVCTPVDITKSMRKLVEDLQDTAEDCENPYALGLSANQIGHSVRAFVIRQGSKFHPIINAEVISKSKKTTTNYESCLSYPNREPVKMVRASKITIRYYCPRIGQYRKGTFKKIDARVVQHEMDHSEGILI